MWSLIAALILTVIAIIWIVFALTWKPNKPTDSAPPAAGPAVVIVLCAALILLASSWAQVPARNVGIPSNFGKITGETLDPGLHFIAPWTKVDDIDATVQPEEYRGEDCIYVKIADFTSACVSLSYRWRIKPENADVVYADYRNSELDLTDAVRRALVSTNVKAAINEEMASYDPLALAEEGDAANAEDVIRDLNAAIQENVEGKIEDVGDLIDIQSVTVSYISLSDTTQGKIDALVAAKQDTRIAEQRKETAAAQAEANRVLSESVSNDPNVLVSRCLDGLIAGDFENQPGFSCWPGGGNGIVVPSAR